MNKLYTFIIEDSFDLDELFIEQTMKDSLPELESSYGWRDTFFKKRCKKKVGIKNVHYFDIFGNGVPFEFEDPYSKF